MVDRTLGFTQQALETELVTVRLASLWTFTCWIVELFLQWSGFRVVQTSDELQVGRDGLTQPSAVQGSIG